MELRRQIAIIRSWFPLLVVSVLLAAGAAFVVSSLLPKVYEAKATLIVGQSLSAVNPDYDQLLVSQRLSTTYAAVATTRPILDSVIQRLGLGVTSDELLKHVRANAPLDSMLLTISAQDADPSRAAVIANALAEQLIAASPAIQGANLLSVVEPAVAPASPESPRPLLNMLVAAIVGLFVAAGIAFTAENLDDTVRDSEAVQEVAGLSTLGKIARMKGGRNRSDTYRLAALLHPRSAVAEAYRTLRANIEFASIDAPVRTLLVTSSIRGEGKTVTAANLAVVFAQAGRRVLLVDADLRKPGVHPVFDLANAHGLTTLLRSDEVSLDALAQPTEQENLRILTAGPLPPDPAELLGSQRMREILERLKAGGDLVIFDSPPLQTVTDSAILSSILDGTLFVIDAGRSHRGAVRLGRESLATAGAKVLGAVLNRVPDRQRPRYSGYSGNYRGFEEGTEKRPRGTEESPTRSVP